MIPTFPHPHLGPSRDDSMTMKVSESWEKVTDTARAWLGILLSLMLLGYILTKQDLIIGMKYMSWQFQMLETAESKFSRPKKPKKQKTEQTKKPV